MAKINGTFKVIISVLVSLILIVIAIFTFISNSTGKSVRRVNRKAEHNAEDITILKVTDERVETKQEIIIKNQEKMLLKLDKL